VISLATGPPMDAEASRDLSAVLVTCLNWLHCQENMVTPDPIPCFALSFETIHETHDENPVAVSPRNEPGG